MNYDKLGRPAVLLNSVIQSFYYTYMNTFLFACQGDFTSVKVDVQNKGPSCKAASASFPPPAYSEW